MPWKDAERETSAEASLDSVGEVKNLCCCQLAHCQLLYIQLCGFTHGECSVTNYLQCYFET
jgi:hypothetical protein